MKTLVMCALLLTAALAWDPNCFKTINRRFYDFNSLKRNSNDVFYQDKFQWNICTSVGEGGDCSDQTSSFVVQTTQCKSYGKDQGFSEVDGGVKITYTNGDTCTDTHGNQSNKFTEMTLTCDKKASDNPKNQDWHVTPVNDCQVNISVNTSSACDVGDLSVFIDFVNKYQTYFAIGGIVIGLLLLFVGFWLFKCTIFIAAVLIVGMILLSLIYGAIGAQPHEEWVTWVLLAVCLIAGLVAGILLLKFQKLAAFILGAIGGWALAFLLYDLFLYKISSSQWVLWVSVVILAIIMGLISLKIYEHMMIISTALIGSYLVNKSVSVWAGGFPNEVELYHYIENSGGQYEMETTYYIYFAAILVGTIIGVIVQEKHKSKRKESTHSYKRMH